MSRYHCRRCTARPPFPLSTGLGGSVICGHCGSLMERRGRLSGGVVLLAGPLLLTVGIVALPEVINGSVRLASVVPGLSRAVARLDPPPATERRPLALLQGDLVERLAVADLAWIPTTEPIAGGGIRYKFRRRLGEPEPSLEQIKAMIDNPPDYGEERAAIGSLLRELQRVGVAIDLEATHKPGAAGEWDHSQRTMRLQPLVVQKGTVEFLRVLNHEAIHVAQSCAGGGLRARPRLLGLSKVMHPEMAAQLKNPMYADSPLEERELEREAYANQHQIGLGAKLVRRHCRPHPALAMWRISSRHLPA
jgi:hypothetical protein